MEAARPKLRDSVTIELQENLSEEDETLMNFLDLNGRRSIYFSILD